METNFTPGERYKGTVGFADPKGTYINVAPIGGGPWCKIEIKGRLKKPIEKLKGNVVSFIFREMRGTLPFGELVPEYFLPENAIEDSIGGVTGNASPAKLEGIEESETVEFKSSIINSPKTSNPDPGQLFTIAKEFAAFMNTDGGTLYLGVKDDGSVCGIEKDYPVLGNAEIRTHHGGDKGYAYKPNKDGYAQKLHNLLHCYLGAAASTALRKDPEWLPLGGAICGKVEIPAMDEPVYVDDDKFLSGLAGNAGNCGDVSGTTTYGNVSTKIEKRFHPHRNCRTGNGIRPSKRQWPILSWGAKRS